jgi:hypothetical protein
LASTIESSIPYATPAGYRVNIALLLSALLWASATADERPACPTREAVAQALSPALAAAPAPPLELPPDLRITDLGDAFEVSVAGQAQRFTEAARDCTERARMAAVFIALVLRPPVAPAPPRVVVVAPPPPAPPPPPPPPPPRTTSVGVAVAARVDAAAGGGSSASGGVGIGGEAQIYLGRRWLGLEATAGALSSTEAAFQTVRVRQQRFPCSLAAAARGRVASRLELSGAAGVALTPFTLNPEGLRTPTPGTRLDVGARVAVGAHWTGHALAPFAEAHAEWFPRTYTIAVTPLGAIGDTAPWQLGLSIGLELAVRTRP